MNLNLPIEVKGHLNVRDDLGNVLVDKDNAVHPQNMARIIARALSNESNANIYRIAFGNGGTDVNAAFTVTYNTPNDGQSPDVSTYDSRLYNETYSEIIDEGNPTLNPLLGTDPGSADSNTGNRAGGGAEPADDPISVPHVSGPGVRSSELGLTSEVVITCVLNENEPSGQFLNDNLAPSSSTDTSFVFDEIGLYTSGAPAIATNGSQDVDVGNRVSTDDTGLVANTTYDFNIVVDGGSSQNISITVPLAGGSGSGGEYLYGDLCDDINASLLTGADVTITDNAGTFASLILGTQTFGFLRFTSQTTGTSSTIALSAGTILDLFAAINPPTGGTILTAVAGQAAGLQNDPVNPTDERERLLTHIIFSPVLKAASRVLTITYTLTVFVARSS